MLVFYANHKPTADARFQGVTFDVSPKVIDTVQRFVASLDNQRRLRQFQHFTGLVIERQVINPVTSIMNGAHD